MSDRIREDVYKIMVYVLMKRRELWDFQNFILRRDVAITQEDILHELYTKFLELEYDKRFDEDLQHEGYDEPVKLTAYVKQFLLWQIMSWCRLLNFKPVIISMNQNIRNGDYFEEVGMTLEEMITGEENGETLKRGLVLLEKVLIDENDPEKQLLAKEAMKYLEQLIPDKELRDLALGEESQTEIAKRDGVSRQRIHEKVKKAREKAQEQWRTDEEEGR